MGAIIKLKISNNPIKEEDLNLFVLCSRGILDYCQTQDKKRFYVVSTFEYHFCPNFIPSGYPREQIFYVRYISQALSPKYDSYGNVSFPMPVDCEDAGRETWFSLQTGGKIRSGDLTIKSDKSGQLWYLFDNNEKRAFQLWERNITRIESFAAAMEHLGIVIKNEARIARIPKRCGTSTKEIKKKIRESEIEERLQAKLRAEAIQEME